jgi:hypothetical protein
MLFTVGFFVPRTALASTALSSAFITVSKSLPLIFRNSVRAEWKRLAAFSSGVTLTCTLKAACQRILEQRVNVFGSALAAIDPPWILTANDVVPQKHLIERGQRQMPDSLLDADAVFGHAGGKAELPRRAGL